MSKNRQRTGIFDLNDVTESIQLDSISKFSNQKNQTIPKIPLVTGSENITNFRMPVDKGLLIVMEQMRLSGIRYPTRKEYTYIFNRFIRNTRIEFLDEINLDVIFEFISSLGEVSDVTKQSKLRVLKAILNRFFDNGWIKRKFWKDVKIKVDTKIKMPASKNNLAVLLSLLDMSNFIHFRDAVAILTIYKTGIRMSTLVQLEEKHIDLNTNTLLLTGDIMKNHDILKLPFDEELANYFKRLIEQNNVIRKHYKKRNRIIFISKFGDSLNVQVMPSAITKRLSYYAKRFGLTDISAHAIRRLYAMNLRNKGADVLLISKALHHKSIATTTQYLGLSTDEVAKELRDYL